MYRLLTYTKPDTGAEELAGIFRSVARMVYRERGQFRRIKNLGVRPLAYPFRRPREKYEAARFVECTYDVAPKGLSEVERLLRGDDAVLRFVHLKADDKLAAFRRGEPRRPRKLVLSPADRAKGEFNTETMEMER